MQTQYTILYKYLNEGNAITNDAEYNPTNIFYTGESKINFNLLRFGDLSSAGYNLTLNNYTNTLKSQYVEKYKKEGEEEKLIAMKNAYLEKEKFKNLYLYDRTDTVYSKVFIPEQNVLLANRNRIPEQQRPTSENDFTKPFKFLDDETCYLDPKFTELYAKEYITKITTITFDNSVGSKGKAIDGSIKKRSTIIKTGEHTETDIIPKIDSTTNPKISDYDISPEEFDKLFSGSTGPYTKTYIEPLIGETVFLKLSTEDVKNEYSSLNKTRAYNYKGNYIYNFEEEIAKEIPLKAQIYGIGSNGEEPVFFKEPDYVTDDDVLNNYDAYFNSSDSIKAPGLYSYNGEDYLVTRMACQTSVARWEKDNKSVLSDASILRYQDYNGALQKTQGIIPAWKAKTNVSVKTEGDEIDSTEQISNWYSYLFISTNGNINASKLPNLTDISKINDLTVGFCNSSYPTGVNFIYRIKDAEFKVDKGTGEKESDDKSYSKWVSHWKNVLGGSSDPDVLTTVSVNSIDGYRGKNNYIDRDNCNYTHIRSYVFQESVCFTYTKNPNQVKSYSKSDFTSGEWWVKVGSTVTVINDSNIGSITKGSYITQSSTAPDPKKATFNKLKKFFYGEIGYFIHYFGIPVSSLQALGIDKICTEVSITGNNISQKVLLPNEYNSDSAPYFIKDIYKKIDEAPWMVYSHEKSLQAAVNKCKALVKRVGIDNVKLIKNINVESIIDVN